MLNFCKKLGEKKLKQQIKLYSKIQEKQKILFFDCFLHVKFAPNFLPDVFLFSKLSNNKLKIIIHIFHQNDVGMYEKLGLIFLTMIH